MPSSVTGCRRPLPGSAPIRVPLKGNFVLGSKHTWIKIRNPNYSQMVGRDELFERMYEGKGAPKSAGMFARRRRAVRRKTGRRTMSAAGRRRIAAAQKARWAALKGKKGGATKGATTAKTGGTRHVSAAARRKMAAAQKARWAKIRAAKKAV
jgi:hypothetical protein